MLESEADRLASIKALGGEPFSTGNPENLWGIFDRESFDSDGNFIPVKNRRPVILCRESDVQLHGLINKSVVTRISDGSTYVVKDSEPDGVGMVLINLGV